MRYEKGTITFANLDGDYTKHINCESKKELVKFMH